MNNQNSIINPLVTLIKIKKGVKEKIELDGNVIKLTIQQLLYSLMDKQYAAREVRDEYPLILVLAIVNQGKLYKLFSASDIKFNLKVTGIYGLNLDMLLSENEKNLKLLLEIKTRILSAYQTYLLPGIKEEVKKEQLGHIQSLVHSIYEMYKTLNNTQKVLIENPFYFYKDDYILFSSTIKDTKLIDYLKNFRPKTFEISKKEDKKSEPKVTEKSDRKIKVDFSKKK